MIDHVITHPAIPQYGGRICRVSEMLPDTVNDLIGAKLRRMNNITSWCPRKQRLRDELDRLCDFHGYIGFWGDPRNYAAHLVGQSFLYDVGSKQRGWLEFFQGMRVRIVCIQSGQFRRWLRVGKVSL